MKIIDLKYGELDSKLIDKLADFLTVGFSYDNPELWKKRFDYWWKANPTISADDTICWYLYDSESDSIGGFIGRIPLTFQHGSQNLKASAATSWYVIDEMRGVQSTRLFMKYNREKDTDIFLDTTPSVPVQTMLPDIGFKKVGGDTNSTYVIITSLKSFSSMMSNVVGKASESRTGIKKMVFRLCAALGSISSNLIPQPKQKSDISVLSSKTHEIRICTDSQSFIQCLSYHKKGDTIELAKDEASINWILFSPEVHTLLNRKTIQIFTKTGEYCGYLIYDVKPMGNYPIFRVTELQLVHADNDILKLILQYLKGEARGNNCVAIHFSLRAPAQEIESLLHKNIPICMKRKNAYHVKFRDGVVADVDPYSIYVPSTLDPDVGFI